MLVRAAYGKTINRPEFRELAPFSFYDFDYNIVYEGYTGLNISTVDNFDARCEFYPTPSELISVAALGAKTFIYKNAKNARSSGIELEIKN
jgi:outer membrane receptor protein involved in Fe transport